MLLEIDLDHCVVISELSSSDLINGIEFEEHLNFFTETATTEIYVGY